MRVVRVAAFAAALAVGVGGCGATCACVAAPISPVEGVVIAVDSTGLTDVAGFTLRIEGGSSVQFRLGRLENPTEFSPGHLKEHQATATPVRVFFRHEADQLVVYRLEDASSPAPSSSP